MLRVIIVDDEKMPINQLCRVLSEFDYIQIVDCYTDPLEAIKAIQEIKPDVVFLDIEMPQINGIEVAAKLLEVSPKSEVIFVTAYDKYAIEAFEVCAIGYMLKPARKEKLEKTLQRVLKSNEDNKSEKFIDKKVSKYSIQCLGKIDILKDKQPMNINFRSAKVKELFAYYVHYRNRRIHREELVELFWTDMKYEKALTNLNTTHYYLKKILQEAVGNRIQIVYKQGYYQLELSDIVYDIDELKESLIFMEDIDEDNRYRYEELIQVLKRPYIDDLDTIWINDTRYYYEKEYTQQYTRLINYYFDQNEFVKCIHMSKEILKTVPYHKEMWEILLVSLKSINDNENYDSELENMKNVMSS